MNLRDLITRVIGGGAAPLPNAVLSPHVEALVPEAIDLVANEIEPNLVYLPRYRKRIEPSIRRTFAHLRAAGTLLPEIAIDISPKTWSATAEINMVFASPADVSAVLARSDDLQRWFREHPDNDEGFAWLGAERKERTGFGMALVGDSVQREVMQTTVSFAEQRIVLPGNTITDARVELGMALFRGLLAIVLERIEALRAHSRSLAEQEAMMKIRLRRIRQQQHSIGRIAGDPGGDKTEAGAAERELKAVSADLLASKAHFATLDGYLTEVQSVLDAPGDYLSVAPVAMRLDHMGIRVDNQFDGKVNDLTLVEIRTKTFQRVAVLVRCLRADLPPPIDRKRISR